MLKEIINLREDKRYFNPLRGHYSENNYPYKFRYKIWWKFICRNKGHRFIPHFTGRMVQYGKDGLIGKEVDFYYCDRCGLKDPDRNEYSLDPNKELRTRCYV